MLIGFIDGSVSVETIGYNAAVGIAVAEFEGVRICSVGHDDLFKILVGGSNGEAIFWGVGVVY